MGWDFLGIPNPRSPSRGLGMGIFHFGLDQKIPGDLKSRGWGSGIWDPQKSPVKNPQKIPNPGDGDSGFLRLKKSPKNPQVKSPKNPQSRGWGFGIFEAEKSPKNPQVKSPKNPQSRGWGFGIFDAEKSPKNPQSKIPRNPQSRGWGFLNPGDIPDPQSQSVAPKS